MMSMKKPEVNNSNGLPESFRPLLWSLKWEEVNISKDKNDIILNTVNEGTFDQWHWILETYGKKVIRETLAKRLTTEFYPESRNLARVVFGLPPLSYAR